MAKEWTPKELVLDLVSVQSDTYTKMEIDANEQSGTLILKTVTDRFDIETFCVLLIFIIYIVFFLKFIYKLFK